MPGMAILYGMKTPTVKATYSLDVETMRVLERVARRWGVSKSEALRRAIRASAQDSMGPSTPLATLDQMQAAAELGSSAAAEWAKEVRTERRAARPPSRAK